jgi:chaperonin GroES
MSVDCSLVESCPLGRSLHGSSAKLACELALHFTLIRRLFAMNKIRPLQDRVLIRRLKEEEKTAGGIIIPDTAKEKPLEGEVVAVGKGKVLKNGTLRKLDVKIGDRVLFSKYTGSEVKVDVAEHLVIREDDILAVVGH